MYLLSDSVVFLHFLAGQNIYLCEGKEMKAWLFTFEQHCADFTIIEKDHMYAVGIFLHGDARK
ncbi:hypothetical protein DSO57_1025503 [Entomophthora muscae]|uniref:Uncharacterized protein n=1 Tax=Entomophthora muscae TaxID=34485 RepID=A0ACC2SF80_9FUNG|nr:hypothetical protein DSO57_1025503 [Entomophthora muscae]